MIELGLLLRALLMAVCRPEMVPDVSLTVTTLLSPEGFSMNELLGTV